MKVENNISNSIGSVIIDFFSTNSISIWVKVIAGIIVAFLVWFIRFIVNKLKRKKPMPEVEMIENPFYKQNIRSKQKYQAGNIYVNAAYNKVSGGAKLIHIDNESDSDKKIPEDKKLKVKLNILQYAIHDIDENIRFIKSLFKVQSNGIIQQKSLDFWGPYTPSLKEISKFDEQKHIFYSNFETSERIDFYLGQIRKFNNPDFINANKSILLCDAKDFILNLLEFKYFLHTAHKNNASFDFADSDTYLKEASEELKDMFSQVIEL